MVRAVDWVRDPAARRFARVIASLTGATVHDSLELRMLVLDLSMVSGDKPLKVGTPNGLGEEACGGSAGGSAAKRAAKQLQGFQTDNQTAVAMIMPGMD